MASIIPTLIKKVWGSSLGENTLKASPKTCVSVTDLFARVESGNECDYDCTSCVIKYPKNFKIDEEDELYGTIQEWSTHLLVATGKSDWVRDVADEEGSVMEAIVKFANVKPNNGVGSKSPCLSQERILGAKRKIEIDAFCFQYSDTIMLC